MNRDSLPIPDPDHPGDLPFDARDPAAVFPPIEPLRPPARAPSVLIVLLDDVGFGASSAFGGPCHTPTAERLAAGGLKFNRFHTTARRLTEGSVINVKNKSHSVTAEVEAPAEGAAGVVVAQGGAFGGWALYARGGRLKYCHNFLGLQRFTVEAERGVPEGIHQVRMEFEYAGGGLGKGAAIRLYVDGEQTGAGEVAATVPLIFSGDETTDVGQDTASPVTDDYSGEQSVFNGTVRWVQIDVNEAAEDVDHLITPEERLRVAMARQ